MILCVHILVFININVFFTLLSRCIGLVWGHCKAQECAGSNGLEKWDETNILELQLEQSYVK